MASVEAFDVVVVGGGPAGATAAADLAKLGRKVLLLDKAGRIKPCGGAIPPRLIRDFDIPDHLLVARIGSARMLAPSEKSVDMPVDDGKGPGRFVGMVDREVFDEWLRERAALRGAERRAGSFVRLDRTADGATEVVYRPKDAADGREERVAATAVIGADGANSAVGRQVLPDQSAPFVFAYHEILKAPAATDRASMSGAYDPKRCDVYYQGRFSPDFYAWVFPHGDHLSVGTGSAHKGFSLRGSIAELRAATGLDACETVRREGAPIPMKPLKRWDDGVNVLLAGDAAGVVAPASGEGIYYAMVGGRLAAEAIDGFLETGDVRELAQARKRFMKAHGRVFFILGIMQRFWYGNDKRRERFVTMCRDKDVQRLTWDAYMNKELVRAKPAAHVRIFFKDLAHLFGLVPP